MFVSNVFISKFQNVCWFLQHNSVSCTALQLLILPSSLHHQLRTTRSSSQTPSKRFSQVAWSHSITIMNHHNEGAVLRKWLSMPGAKQKTANPDSCWDHIFFMEVASLLHLILCVLLTSFWCLFRIQHHHNKAAVMRGKIVLSRKSHSCAFASDSLCTSDKLLMFLHVVTDP